MQTGISPPRLRVDKQGCQAKAAGLRKGYTTGACAAAAAKAATQALLTRRPVAQVELLLPMGELALFPVERCELDSAQALCVIVKDGGDDPDVTHGAEICATVNWQSAAGVSIEAGQGVGVATKPGLELPVGEPAINPVPRQMISRAVSGVLISEPSRRGVKVVISVARGEDLARKTLNHRLGIVGGISILGTTGIVVPFSTDAYTATIAQALGIAVASGCREVVLTTGRRSERFAQALIELPEEAFVQMGDFVGFALEECAQRRVQRVTICAMIGKLSKIAAGHLQTHVSRSQLAPSFLAGVAADCGASADLVRAIAEANTGRHFGELARDGGMTTTFQRLCELAAQQCSALLQGKIKVVCMLTDFDGTLMARAAVE